MWCTWIEVTLCRHSAAPRCCYGNIFGHNSSCALVPVPGVIASNGVNGSPRTEQLPQGSGIQVTKGDLPVLWVSTTACGAVSPDCSLNPARPNSSCLHLRTGMAACLSQPTAVVPPSRDLALAHRCIHCCTQGDFNLSNLQDGFLATAFLVGLLIASPIFSEACKHYSAFR